MTAGAAAWAVQLPPVAAVGVGVAGWLAKAFTAAWQETSEPPPEENPALPVRTGSPEERWLLRARKAAEGFADLTKSMRGELLLDRVAAMRPQVEDAVAVLRRLAEHASLTGDALRRFDPEFLRQERLRLTHARESARPEIAGELDRSLASLTAQEEVYGRLTSTYSRVLARMESATMSLEGMVARTIEVATMTATSAPGDNSRVLDDLTAELDLTRQALHDAENAARDTY